MALGHGVYSAKISFIGGKGEVFSDEVSSCSWNREVSNISDATVVFNQGECCDLLKLSASLVVLELHIFRQAVCNGVASKAVGVWSGRIKTMVSDGYGGVTINASDFSSWLMKRVVDPFDYKDIDSNVAAKRIINSTLVKDNSMDLVVQSEDSTILVSDEVKAGSVPYVLDQVNEFVRGSSYWTQIGRYFRMGLVCDSSYLFTEDDFADLPAVTFDADEYANKTYVTADDVGEETGGDVRYSAESSRLVVQGYEVLVEKYVSSNVASGVNGYKLAKKFLDESQEIGVIVDVQRSVLNPNSGVDINAIVPGCSVSVAFNTFCGRVASKGFFRALNVSFDGSNEQISMEIGPSVVEESSRKILSG